VGSVVDINFPPRITAQGIQEVAILEQFKEALVWLRGPSESGKTGTGMALSYGLREHYNKIPILDFHPNESFGEYIYKGPKEFVECLEQMGDIIDECNKMGVTPDVMRGKLGEALGFSIENTTWFLDEAYRYLRKRRATSKVVIAYGDFIAIRRHYHLAIILCSPGEELDSRAVDDQKPIELNCSFNPQLKEVHAHGWNPKTSRAIHLYTPMEIYGKMYDSWNPQAVLRSKKLEIRGV